MSGAGKYDTWLQFYRKPKPETLDVFGASTSVPEFHFESWGAFEPVGTREFPVAHKRQAETTARFRIPWPDYAIDPARHTIQMIFDEASSPQMASTWNITGVMPDDGRKSEMLIEINEVK